MTMPVAAEPRLPWSGSRLFFKYPETMNRLGHFLSLNCENTWKQWPTVRVFRPSPPRLGNMSDVHHIIGKIQRRGLQWRPRRRLLVAFYVRDLDGVLGGTAESLHKNEIKLSIYLTKCMLETSDSGPRHIKKHLVQVFFDMPGFLANRWPTKIIPYLYCIFSSSWKAVWPCIEDLY